MCFRTIILTQVPWSPRVYFPHGHNPRYLRCIPVNGCCLTVLNIEWMCKVCMGVRVSFVYVCLCWVCLQVGVKWWECCILDRDISAWNGVIPIHSELSYKDSPSFQVGCIVRERPFYHLNCRITLCLVCRIALFVYSRIAQVATGVPSMKARLAWRRCRWNAASRKNGLGLGWARARGAVVNLYIYIYIFSVQMNAIKRDWMAGKRPYC